MGRGSLGRVLLLQLSSHLVPLLLQESSHLVPLLLQESSLHFLSFFVKTFYIFVCYKPHSFLLKVSHTVAKQDNRLYTRIRYRDVSVNNCLQLFTKLAALVHCSLRIKTVKRSLPAISGHGEMFPYTSSILSVYVVIENVWTPFSASSSRLLQQ